MNRGKRLRIGSVVSGLLGLLCALVLGAVFYGAMVYQLAGDGTKPVPQAAQQQTPAPLAQGMSATALYPGPLLALADAQMEREHAADEVFGGQVCRVIRRTYRTPTGAAAETVSAYPAAYLERIGEEGYIPQLITGFSLAGMDAVYAFSGEKALLLARSGECVYAIEAQADEQTLYALGAQAYLE